MDRSLAGRVAIGRSLGSLSLPRRRPAGRPGARSRTPRRASGRTGGRGLALRSLTAPLRWLGALVCGHRRLRIALLLALVAVPALAAGWLWLRDSSLVAVERVQVSGVHGPEAQAIDAALVGAARHMSTLDVHRGALRAAVAPYRVVREVRGHRELPPRPAHSRRRAAAGGRAGRSPAGARPWRPTASCSARRCCRARCRCSTAVRAARRSDRRRGSACGSLLAGLPDRARRGARPAGRARSSRVFTGPNGVRWRCATACSSTSATRAVPTPSGCRSARVLADPSSAGASYVDVRVPERPAAGFAGRGRARSAGERHAGERLGRLDAPRPNSPQSSPPRSAARAPRSAAATPGKSSEASSRHDRPERRPAPPAQAAPPRGPRKRPASSPAASPATHSGPGRLTV